jgi:hypothetical protein
LQKRVALDLLHVGQSIRRQHLDVSLQQFEPLVAEQSLRAGIDELDIALRIDHDDAGGHAVEKDARVLFLRPGAVHHCVHDGNGSQIDETEEDEQEQLDEFAILELEAKGRRQEQIPCREYRQDGGANAWPNAAEERTDDDRRKVR